MSRIKEEVTASYIKHPFSITRETLNMSVMSRSKAAGPTKARMVRCIVEQMEGQSGFMFCTETPINTG
jgi:hypothetical protein